MSTEPTETHALIIAAKERVEVARTNYLDAEAVAAQAVASGVERVANSGDYWEANVGARFARDDAKSRLADLRGAWWELRTAREKFGD